MEINRTLLIALALGLTSTNGWAGDGPLWSWHEPATEIYSPSFSTNGDELVLVRKKHTADFHEAEELPESERKKLSDPIETNERYADPEVVSLKIGSNAAARVDWGWAPAFSPDGQQIVYAHQKKPISRFRVLAETLAGNDIRLFGRESKAITVLATPATAYLSDPIFAPDGKYVVYSLSDAINGAWGGNIGIGRVSIDGTADEILYPATKDFGLYHLIDSKRFVGKRLLAMRSKPTSGGTFLAGSYLYELLDIGPPVKPIYAWPAKDRDEYPMAFCSDAKGNLIIFHRGWQPVTAPTKSKNSKAKSNDESAGVPSPDGRLVARRGDSGLEILEMDSRKTVKTIKLRGDVESIRWAPDSRRFAIVLTRHKEKNADIFDFDEIAVYGL
ncbi:MAG TPA: hypothetical protein VJU77_10805 [Chthoniobacterales bacterium]|nr:hypothetical protein [Chthoniobacterales bacterium]